ncbi:VWA domain-containing protein [Streptomyces sp. NBC_01433]|uniref:vWA domain-containing protein n=1 Tax=Streptomyces sp. NBC_01433 TaxID=2903864 RepID=UPI00225AEE7A|nr:VWA domain-containing protein [Streptomyces sp. NBC_01433]MCX4676984.1 VWA domain-containing protein [Streptomyces sp. NBC_01433]
MSPYNTRGAENRDKEHRAVLIGVDSYEHEIDLPAVAQSLRLMAEALTDPSSGVFNTADLVTFPALGEGEGERDGEGRSGAARSVDPLKAHAALRAARKDVTGLLVVYFAGHGIVRTNGSDLHLLFSTSRVTQDLEHPFVDALSWHEVMAELRHAKADRVVVILDCCFAGNASQDFNPEAQQNFAVLMAAEQGVEIPPGAASYGTDFTIALHKLLTGWAVAGEPAGFTRIVSAIRKEMAPFKAVDGHRWVPKECRQGGDVLLALTPASERAKPEPPQPRPPSPVVREDDGPGAPDEPGEPGPVEPVEPVVTEPAGGRGRVRQRLRALGRNRVAAVALALAVGAGAVLWLALDGLPGGETGGCAPPMELRVLVDPDLRPTVQKAADAYVNRDAEGCRTVGIGVYAGKSTDAVAAFQSASLWQSPLPSCPASGDCPRPQRDLGAQPDIWIPAAGSTPVRAEAGQTGSARETVSLDPMGPLAFTPMVLAVPDGKPAATGARTPAPLGTLIAGLRDGRPDGEKPIQVLRPDPEGADGALLSTAALYASPSAGQPSVIEAGMADELRPMPTTAQELMCALSDGTRNELEDRAAVLVPEQTMALFNLPSKVSGQGTRPSCASDTLQRRTARYPTDVPVLDLPFVRVTWADADRDEKARERAVRDFHDWLVKDDAAQALFVQDGFRGVEDGKPVPPGTASPLRAPANEGAVSIEVPDSAPAASAASVADALRDYRQALGPGRVLYLLDNSTSMADKQVWSGPGRAKELVTRSMRSLGTLDRYGVWTLAPVKKDDHPDVVPFGRHGLPTAQKAVGAAKVVDADADIATGLTDALAELREGASGPDPRLIVLVTDDEDSSGLRRKDIDAVVRAAGQGPPVRVVAVSLRNGGCAPGQLNQRLAEATGGRCLDPSDGIATELTAEVAKTGTGDAE